MDLEKGHLLYNTQRTIVGDKTVFAAFVYDTFGCDPHTPSLLLLLSTTVMCCVHCPENCGGEVVVV